MDATQTQDLKQQLQDKWNQRNALNMEMAAIEKQLGGQAMQDYSLTRHDGSTVRLSEMFGEHSQMVLVHNMGFACSYCSLWADGFNGYYHHLESGAYGQRAKFLLVSNDRPDQQQAGASQRGWKFDMLSCRDTSLSMDWGYARTDGDKVHYSPGMMIIEKNSDGTLRCHQQTGICPGDSLMGLFHIFVRLPDTDGKAFE